MGIFIPNTRIYWCFRDTRKSSNSLKSGVFCLSVSPSLCLSVSIYLSISLSRPLSLCLPLSLSLSLSEFYLSVSLSLCLSAFLSLCLSVCPSVSLSVCPSVSLPVCLSVSLSFCLSVSLPLCLSAPTSPSSQLTEDSETSTWVVSPQASERSPCAIKLAFSKPVRPRPCWGRRSSRAARSRSAAPTAGGKRFVNQSSKASFRSLRQVALTAVNLRSK
jgi:hypothetical protein